MRNEVRISELEIRSEQDIQYEAQREKIMNNTEERVSNLENTVRWVNRFIT